MSRFSSKFASSIALVIILVGISPAAFKVQRVEASGTIYIRADGSIDPPTAPIYTADNVTYTLTDNITSDSDGIVVERSNITLDGNQYVLQGSGTGNGITLFAIEKVTVRNIQITAFAYGTRLNSSSSNSISGNDITANNYAGIMLGSSHGTSISGNNITNNNRAGIYLRVSSNNSVSGNNITANKMFGIYLDSSSNNSISGNNVAYGGITLGYSSNNSVSGNTFTDGGLYVFSSYLNSMENNTVNGRPLVYLEGVADYSVGDAGQVVLVRCDRIRVENLNLSRASTVQLWETNNSIVSGNNITNNGNDGIWLAYSFNNSIVGNNITNNNRDGIHLSSSSNNNVSGNNITANKIFGIWLISSSNNSISGNNIANNWNMGIYLGDSPNNSLSGNNITNNGDYGIRLSSSWICTSHICTPSNAGSYNSIVGNNITNNNRAGIYLDSSSNNSIVGNSISASNEDGIHLYYSSNNTIYHNNFVNNTQHVRFEFGYANFWDDGYPSGGNYWSGYRGVDLYSGPYQNETGYDWIGDSPYVIDQNNIDRYPLMHPFVPEMEGIRIAYRNLLLKYDELQEQIDLLNSTYKNLQESISNLMSTFNSTRDHLQGQINSLNQTCISLNQSVIDLQEQLDLVNMTLQASINNLQDQQKALSNQVNTIQNALYVLAASIVILIVAIVYVAIRKPRIETKTEKGTEA
jgi:parallel beta-helix repeat protein